MSTEKKPKKSPVGDEKYFVDDSRFWKAWISKLLFTLISVKVWGLVASITISTILLLNDKVKLEILGETFEITKGITGAQWVTFNTTIWALIFGMKEIFRIGEQREKGDKELVEKKGEVQQELVEKRAESKKVLASILSNQTAGGGSQFLPDGTEVVGDEPEE